MGAVNYGTGDYITFGLNVGQIAEQAEQEYLQSVADSVIDEYGFCYFHVAIKPGYYDGFTVQIENNFPVAFDWYQEKRDAQKEITQLKKCLLELCKKAGLVQVFPGWCTGYSTEAETRQAIKKAVQEMRSDVKSTPTWAQYNRGCEYA